MDRAPQGFGLLAFFRSGSKKKSKKFDRRGTEGGRTLCARLHRLLGCQAYALNDVCRLRASSWFQNNSKLFGLLFLQIYCFRFVCLLDGVILASSSLQPRCCCLATQVTFASHPPWCHVQRFVFNPCILPPFLQPKPYIWAHSRGKANPPYKVRAVPETLRRFQPAQDTMRHKLGGASVRGKSIGVSLRI